MTNSAVIALTLIAPFLGIEALRLYGRKRPVLASILMITCLGCAWLVLNHPPLTP